MAARDAIISPGALAVAEQRLTAYRHFWRSSLVSSVLEPALFLAAMGLTLGVLVDRGTGLPDGVAYLSFLAPGLLAAAAMQLGSFESTYPVLGAIKWQKTYEAVLATPAGVRDLLVGHLLYVAFRVGTSAALFLGVLVLFGAADSLLVLLALPAALLTGMAFAAPVTAFSATLENDPGFAALQRFGILPMFLFSGTFFPVAQLPAFFEAVAYATPLWHGVSLARGLALGTIEAGPALLHVGYLLLWSVVGAALAVRTFTRRLVT
ncbi:lipooligosaccharide transport system permease protein [Geodermatophilus pulveris]|uniref:Transport permease protein n=1 Tax=Geodermatophilus pulveris TaxID=1564159 RepID=A0A239IIR8_9ACTN|nr:ABC transporter permease [Geodermatophilus pulveris]SNS93419.1 lipooligosaccharide transport system permease protein [Geodermatophilus pulveris]